MSSCRRKLLDRLLLPVVKSDGIILDIGGRRRKIRGEFGHHSTDQWVIINIDPSTVPSVQADAMYLPIRSETINVVYCLEVIEYVARPEVLIEEITRVLAPGGLLFLSWPLCESVHGDAELECYRPSLQKILNCLSRCQIQVIEYHRIGGLLAVCFDLIRAYYTSTENRTTKVKFLLKFLQLTQRWILKNDPLFQSARVTTGYLVKGYKRGQSI